MGMYIFRVLPQAFPVCAVDIMSHTQVFLDKSFSQLPSPVIIDQDQQVQVRQRMDISRLKRSVDSDQCDRPRAYRLFLPDDSVNDFPVPVFQCVHLVVPPSAPPDPAGSLPNRAAFPGGPFRYRYSDSSFATCSSEYCRRSSKKFRMSCTWDIRTFAPFGPPGQVGQKRS